MFSMRLKRRAELRKYRSNLGFRIALACWLYLWPGLTPAQDQPSPAAQLSCPEIEQFLLKAKMISHREIPTGVTVPRRATMEGGNLRHDASIQTIDEKKTVFQSLRGTELNFRDSWKFNVAGYELAKILDLNMVPPYVERKFSGKMASFSWWINDAMMERDRLRNKIQPPDTDSWNKQMYAVWVFHQLIYDTDPNLTNILITRDWQIWMVDFTRAFRWMKELQNPKNLLKCDRRLLARLRELNKEIVKAKLSRWLSAPEMEGLVARAAKIVEFFDREVAAKGEAAVLYDVPRTKQPCGLGL